MSYVKATVNKGGMKDAEEGARWTLPPSLKVPMSDGQLKDSTGITTDHYHESNHEAVRRFQDKLSERMKEKEWGEMDFHARRKELWRQKQILDSEIEDAQAAQLSSYVFSDSKNSSSQPSGPMSESSKKVPDASSHHRRDAKHVAASARADSDKSEPPTSSSEKKRSQVEQQHNQNGEASAPTTTVTQGEDRLVPRGGSSTTAFTLIAEAGRAQHGWHSTAASVNAPSVAASLLMLGLPPLVLAPLAPIVAVAAVIVAKGRKGSKQTHKNTVTPTARLWGANWTTPGRRGTTTSGDYHSRNSRYSR